MTEALSPMFPTFASKAWQAAHWISEANTQELDATRAHALSERHKIELSTGNDVLNTLPDNSGRGRSR